MSTFLFHPAGITVKIIGTDFSRIGRSRYDHHIFGSLLNEDVVVCFRRLQIIVVDKDRSFIAA